MRLDTSNLASPAVAAFVALLVAGTALAELPRSEIPGSSPVGATPTSPPAFASATPTPAPNLPAPEPVAPRRHPDAPPSLPGSGKKDVIPGS